MRSLAKHLTLTLMRSRLVKRPKKNFTPCRLSFHFRTRAREEFQRGIFR